MSDNERPGWKLARAMGLDGDMPDMAFVHAANQLDAALAKARAEGKREARAEDVEAVRVLLKDEDMTNGWGHGMNALDRVVETLKTLDV